MLISDNWSIAGVAGREHGVAPQCNAGACGDRTARLGTYAIDNGSLQVRPNILLGINTGAASSSPARAWNDHMVGRDNAETYDCLLSFGLGGELRSGGYSGIKLLGRTLTLSGAQWK